jgi:hypothetical protein
MSNLFCTHRYRLRRRPHRYMSILDQFRIYETREPVPKQDTGEAKKIIQELTDKYEVQRNTENQSR